MARLVTGIPGCRLLPDLMRVDERGGFTKVHPVEPDSAGSRGTIREVFGATL